MWPPGRLLSEPLPASRGRRRVQAELPARQPGHFCYKAMGCTQLHFRGLYYQKKRREWILAPPTFLGLFSHVTLRVSPMSRKGVVCTHTG